jgi:hypothetical protein
MSKEKSKGKREAKKPKAAVKKPLAGARAAPYQLQGALAPTKGSGK